MAQHKRDLRPANLVKVDDNNFNQNTVLVKHVITKDHQVNWDHSKILTFEIDYTKRRFLESFFIHNFENAINDKENCFYSEIYDKLMYSCLSFAFKLFVLPFSFDCVAHYLYCLTHAFVYY